MAGMPLDLYLAFVAATAVLILTPGPVVALVVDTSVRYGAGRGLLTVAGSASAMGVHLVLVCFGLATLLASLGEAIFWLKWIGAAYLVYLGLRALMSRETLGAGEGAATMKSARRAYAEGFAVAISNPKPLIFYAAFFPLFIVSDRAAAPQLILLSITFFVVGVSLDCCWAIAADRARPLLARAGRWGNRVSGGVLLLAAAGLAGLKRQ